jgi:hypothetical protein
VPRRYEVVREWRKLHNRELNDLYFSSNIVRVIKLIIRWAVYVARTGERRCIYKVLVGKPKGKGPLGRSSCKWKDSFFNLVYYSARSLMCSNTTCNGGLLCISVQFHIINKRHLF